MTEQRNDHFDNRQVTCVFYFIPRFSSISMIRPNQYWKQRRVILENATAM